MKARTLFEIYNNSFGALCKDVKHRELITTGGPDDPTLVSGKKAKPIKIRPGSWNKIELKRPEAGGTFSATWDGHVKAINRVADRWEQCVAKKQGDSFVGKALYVDC